MNKPTDEQIKEVFEWCGLEESLGYFYHKGTQVFESSDSIDLNNLFKYAVPFLDEGVGYKKTSQLLVKWIIDVLDGKDPALALFWAIYEIIKNSNKKGNEKDNE